MTSFDDKVVQGYYEPTADGIHFEFYGSNQIEDVILDFLAFKFFGKHIGFEIGYKRAMKIVEANIGAAKNIWLTGHSFGGPLAVLVGAELQKRGLKVKIQTAGAPRVGGPLWCWLVGRHLDYERYQVIGDIVPKSPPWWMGWKHTGKLIWIDRSDIKVDLKNLLAKHVPNAYNGHVPFQL